MIKIEETKNKELILNIVNKPKVLELIGQNHISNINLNHMWLLGKENNQIIGFIEFKEFNKITVEGHIILHPEYHKTGKSLKFTNEAFKYLKKHTYYKNILASVPVECKHIMKFLEKLNFKVIGLMKDSIIHNNRLQDLLLYQGIL
jgi:RimJ/RimL family protein N-acetyltransferase